MHCGLQTLESAKGSNKLWNHHCIIFPSLTSACPLSRGGFDSYWQGILLSSLLRQKKEKKEENLISCETFFMRKVKTKKTRWKWKIQSRLKGKRMKIKWRNRNFSRQSQNVILMSQGINVVAARRQFVIYWNMRRIKMWVFNNSSQVNSWWEFSSGFEVCQCLMDFHLSLDESIGALEEWMKLDKWRSAESSEF